MNKLLICGAVLGLVSVVMGAVGDHMVPLTAETAHSLETAIRYNMTYAVLLVVLSLVTTSHKYAWCGWIFTAAVTLFSGSIYLSIFTHVRELTYLTPVGGLGLMLGWIALIVAGIDGCQNCRKNGAAYGLDLKLFLRCNTL